MSNISGTNLAAGITPFTTEDKYPTHYSEYGKGGWREVQTITDRDNIPEGRRSLGMAVYVVENDRTYILKSSGWVEFTGGSGGGGGGDLSNYYNKTETDNLLNEKANVADVYTKEEIDNTLETTYATKSEIPTKISDLENDSNFIDKDTLDSTLGAYETTESVDSKLDLKADKSDTLAGYGITDAYTKTETDKLIDAVTPLFINIPIRTLQDKVYTKEEILRWFGVTEESELKSIIVKNIPIFLKYGISLSYNPHYYKMPVQYIAFETAVQIKLVIVGLNTKDDVVSKYEIILNLDEALIAETNSNVGVNITSLEEAQIDLSEYVKRTEMELAINTAVQEHNLSSSAHEELFAKNSKPTWEVI